jgi:RNA recognition motif-containing protein
MGARLYVANLSYDLTKRELRTFFKEVGEPKEIKLITDPNSGQNRGYAFVEMESALEANRAIMHLRGRMLHGRDVVISVAREKVGMRTSI